MKQLLMELPTVGKVTLIKLMPYSTTQVYLWEKGVEDRKIREPQGMVDNNCLQNAVNLIRALPHLGAAKGQAYMIYHRLGYIPQHVYKTLKKMVRRLTNQEVQQRDLLGEKQSFEHVVTSEPDEIWAEDFTELPVEKKVFKLAVVIDVHTNYYLGISVGLRATTALVEGPVTQAVAVNKGKGPSAFMLSDNGKQYISDQHEQKLDSLAIVHRRIPACKPQYNGSVECGIKEIKNVFYSLWARRRENKQEADEKKTLTQLVQEVAFETQRAMNEEIPRPCLSGITAYDAYTGRAEEQIGACQQYIEQETVKRKEGAQWGALDWSKVKRQLFNPNMSNIKLMTTFCQLLKRPLRMLAKIHKGVLGNYEKIFFGFS